MTHDFLNFPTTLDGNFSFFFCNFLYTFEAEIEQDVVDSGGDEGEPDVKVDVEQQVLEPEYYTHSVLHQEEGLEHHVH